MDYIEGRVPRHVGSSGEPRAEMGLGMAEGGIQIVSRYATLNHSAAAVPPPLVLVPLKVSSIMAALRCRFRLPRNAGAAQNIPLTWAWAHNNCAITVLQTFESTIVPSR
jgi:hypothetical protein